MGYISAVNLRATATFPSLWFIVTADPAFSNWTPPGKRFGSKPTAREEAERLLADARNTIHDLETKLGHERLARDEVTERINAERLQIEEALTAVQEELATERALRARQNGNATRPSLPRRLQNSDCGRERRSRLRTPPPLPNDRPGAGAVGLRRSCGKLPRRFGDRRMVVARVAGKIPVAPL